MRSPYVAVLLALIGLPVTGSAAVLLDTGYLNFSGTGSQFGRVGRDGLASTWGSDKPFPGIVGAPTVRAYQTFTVNNGTIPFLQISLDDPTAGLFVTAYLDSFTPVNLAPNYGLNVNYLGDPGLTQPFDSPSFFQIEVAPGSRVVLSINEVTALTGEGLPFNLIVEGFLDADYTDTPEPGTFVLFGAAFALLLMVRGAKPRQKSSAAVLLLLAGFGAVGRMDAQQISAGALDQINALMREKQGRNAVQRKLSPALVYATSRLRGVTPANIDTLGNAATSLHMDSRYGVLVDIKTTGNTAGLAALIRLSGGRVIYAGASGQIRARVPLRTVEALGARADVRFIKAGLPPKSSGKGAFNLARYLESSFFVGLTSTQGIVTHGTSTAIRSYGANGTGVRIGVLSDSAESVPALIASGDLPSDTQNVADLLDGPGSSEGSAMMEIIHDMAPGARLFFASAFNGPESFADNIRLLRNTYLCDIIVDDVGYSDEGVFQDTAIAKAVNDVTQSGAVYFSSAGNAGNFTNGNSSTWEGDFVAGPPSGPYALHSFGIAPFNQLLIPTSAVELHWSDPWGASSNDYDLFILNPAGTTVLAASVGNQDGTGDPFEEVYSPAGFPAGSLVLVARFSGEARALHLENFFGEPLAIATAGQTHGHNATGGCAASNPACTGRAFGVAAVAWNSARGSIKPFVGGAANPTEPFSSDGPRRIFYHADGTPITPGNVLFGTGGGRLLIKPDIAAADGVACRTPGFSPFFGTSAAAPHAAGVAALLKSARPSATGVDIFNALTSTALDIRAPGVDRDSGFGIVMAPAAVKAIQ